MLMQLIQQCKDVARSYCVKVIFISALLLNSVASAEYTVAMQHNGLSSATVNQGDTITLDLVLTGNALDTTYLATLDVSFSVSGLIIQSYDWSAPSFITEGPDDLSIPKLIDLPQIIDVDTWVENRAPADTVDILLDNVDSNGTFMSGIAATITLQIPIGFPFQNVLINVGNAYSDVCCPVSSAISTPAFNLVVTDSDCIGNRSEASQGVSNIANSNTTTCVSFLDCPTGLACNVTTNICQSPIHVIPDGDVCALKQSIRDSNSTDLADTIQLASNGEYILRFPEIDSTLV